MDVRVHPPEVAVAGADGIVCCTAVVPKDLNPRWVEPLVAPLHVRPGRDTIAGVHLLLTVMDHDLVSSNDVVGTACVSLARCLPAADAIDGTRCVASFEEPLLLNGIGRGTIRGSIEVIVSEMMG